ncbi:hypothetical protein Q5425_32150 [Amycolatopsis sp. A133]|uniref:hypothetical protein n=1 Tax=Amycolatopsis sp. A133 TaxID=3064472 RepID=UPI0027F97EB4|nr:hypothetical protein [Amycolatopsis sp. A133]MDQ7808411.1 hypothetical protein [Amycolatopsis sp. A133]
MNEPAETLEHLFLLRLRGQGPEHPRTRATLQNLIVGKRTRAADIGATEAELPEGIDPDGVRLDGDHVDAEIHLQQLAMHLQQHRVDKLGGDDPRTMIATAYLAYALALGDHLDGQVESAAVLAEDAHDGLADAADEHAEHLGDHDLETAAFIHEWISEKLALS